MTNMESVEVVNKRDITCCFTGHRRIPSEKQGIITERLRDELIKLIEQGYVYFGAGGALGFDTIAAQVVLELKGTYPQIKLILVLPCKTQTRGWSKEAIEVYEDIKGKCDKYVYSSEDYDSSCMFKRNRHLIVVRQIDFRSFGRFIFRCFSAFLMPSRIILYLSVGFSEVKKSVVSR